MERAWRGSGGEWLQMNARYKTLSGSDEPKPPSVVVHEAEGSPIRPTRARFSALWFFFKEILGLLWLAPIVLLLYFNFSGYIIGPSASCPVRGCQSDPLASGNSQWAQHFDRNDHNTLGGLQIVAKILEIWFLFIAVDLVYNIVMILASRESGLPIGLFSSPVEFADPRSLLEVFRAASQSPGQHRLKERALMRLGLYSLVVFLAFMCMLVNLMGPAVAVLVLPTLQWVNLPQKAIHSFNASGLARPPNVADYEVFPNCTNENLNNRLFSCTKIPYAASLDAWDDSVIEAGSQMTGQYSTTQPYGISPEGDVYFTFNATNNLYDAIWAPNRQALREVSADLDYFETASQNISLNPAYQSYNNSLNTVLKRKAPIFGAYVNAFRPENVTTTVVGDNQELRCYGGYQSWLTGDVNFTKCLPIGTAWHPLNKKANFSVAGSFNRSSAGATVNVFFTDTSAYFNGTFNDGLLPSSCMLNGTLSSPNDCDWKTVFSATIPLNSSLVSSNILTIELTMPKEYPDSTAVFEFFTFANFSTYTLDTSPQTNPLYLVQVDDVPDPQKANLRTVPVDPDWVLAAWSVDQDGLIGNRSAAFSLIRGLQALFGPGTFDNTTLEDTGDNGYLNNTYSDIITSTSLGPSTSANSPPTYAAAATSVAAPEYSGTVVTQAQRFKRQGSSASITAPYIAVTSTASYIFNPVTPSEFASTTTGTAPITTTTGLTPESDEEGREQDWYYYQNSRNDDEKDEMDLAGFVYYSYLQALSMVTYSRNNLTRINTDTKDPEHPTLWFYARVHVWAYGTDSRTSKLGITVATIGAVCVILSTILGITSRRRQRSLTELLVAALEHRHMGELNHAAGEIDLKARTRYRIEEDHLDEPIRFRPV